MRSLVASLELGVSRQTCEHEVGLGRHCVCEWIVASRTLSQRLVPPLPAEGFLQKCLPARWSKTCHQFAIKTR